jgi:2-(3-amino-3-carboxypropyl)histidine synthase
MSVCSEHDFELEYVAQVVESHNVKKILVQLPEGFKQCFNYIVEKLREYLSREVEVVLSLNPSYGPCLVDEYSAEELKTDLIIHFGHTEYPFYNPSVKTLFIPVEFVNIDLEKIMSILTNLCSQDKKLCLLSSSQHIKLCNRLTSLSSKCRIVYKGVVYGCTKAGTEECDVLVVVGGGRFLCISQYLMYLRKSSSTVLCLDPYSYTLWNPKEDVEKILRIRIWKMYNSLNRRRWLIISGFYGQAREKLVNTLVEELKRKNFEVAIAKVLKIDRETLINISNSFDVVVIASCPYLAFDFQDLDIPILTIGEAFAVLNNDIDRYRYPW